MTFKLVSILAGSGALSVAAASAIAGHHEGASDWEAKVEAKFTEIDTNKDGTVSEEEYLAYKTAEARSQFAAMGGDDGSVTLAEAKEAYAARAKEGAAMKDAVKEKEAMKDEVEKAEPENE